MSQLHTTAISCGVKQLSDVRDSTPEDVLRDAFREELRYYGEKSTAHLCMILFSDTLRSRYGTGLATFIEKNNLGTITASEIRKNPNSHHNIRTWIWYVNRPALQKWLDKGRETS